MTGPTHREGDEMHKPLPSYVVEEEKGDDGRTAMVVAKLVNCNAFSFRQMRAELLSFAADVEAASEPEDWAVYTPGQAVGRVAVELADGGAAEASRAILVLMQVIAHRAARSAA